MLKLSQLKLTNFRNISNIELNFDSGLNIISGDNGFGKSSILDSLVMLFCDSYEGTLLDYIQWSADYFQIQATGFICNKPFDLLMKYDKKKKNYKELKYGNEPICYNSDVTKRLNELLDSNLLLVSSVVKQFSIDLINTTPAKRRDYLKKVYNLDFKKGIDDIDLIVKNIKDNDLKQLEQKLFLLQNKKYDVKEILPEPFEKNIYESYKNKVIKLNNIVLSQQNNIQRKKQLQDQLNNTVIELTNKQYLLNSIDKDQLITKINNLEAEKKNQESSSNKIIEKLNQEIIDIEKSNDIINLQKQMSFIILSRIKPFDLSGYEKINLEKSILENDITRLQKSINQANSGICSECGQIVDEDHKVKIQNELNEKSLKLNYLVDIITGLNFEKIEFEKKQKENNENQQKKVKLENDIQRTIADQSNKKILLNEKIKNEEQNKINYLALKNKEIEQYLNKIEENKRLEQQYSNDISILQKNVNDISFEISQIKIIDDFDAISNDILDLNNKITNYDKVVNQNELIKKQNEELILSQEKDKLEIDIVLNELNNVQNKINDYIQAKTILNKDFPNYVIKRLSKSIEICMNKFIEETYNGKYEVCIEEKDGSIFVLYGPMKQDVILASGWEKQLFSFAYKYALNKLYNSQFLLLDEFDSAASDSNSEIFCNYLLSLISDSQAIMISHKDSIKELLFQNGASVFEIENGVLIKR